MGAHSDSNSDTASDEEPPEINTNPGEKKKRKKKKKDKKKKKAKKPKGSRKRGGKRRREGRSQRESEPEPEVEPQWLPQHEPFLATAPLPAASFYSNDIGEYVVSSDPSQYPNYREWLDVVQGNARPFFWDERPSHVSGRVVWDAPTYNWVWTWDDIDYEMNGAYGGENCVELT